VPKPKDGPGCATLYASLVMAMIMPITTNTTIATCIHIHVGDILRDSVPAATIV
jgi:hypothetical protein